MTQEFDIDISGSNPNGSDPPAQPPTRVKASTDDLDASFDAALGGDDDFESVDPDTAPPEGQRFMTSSTAHPEPAPAEAPAPAPAPEVEPASPPAARKSPAKKATPKKLRAAKPPAPPPPPPTTGSGPAVRMYAIFRKHKTEVDGQIVEAFVRVAFADPDNPEAGVVEAIRARNRDTALYKAAKLFGRGFEGTLVATPVSMWEEKPVRFKPREQFHVEVGA